MKQIFFLLLLLSVSVAYPQRIITTFAGNGLSNGGVGNDLPITSAVYPFDLAFGPNGDLYFSEFSSYSIRKIDVKLGKISTVAGNGTQGFSGDGGPATSAQFNEPRGIAVDEDGNIYIGDYW
ncbi:MAG: SBBP repeat-containing protein, partial [Flammeovirgaceae bacterium]|nr:SBBP repeat-containing protein [Flammeovirgaceae bacterium]